MDTCADFKIALTTSEFIVITEEGDNASEIDLMLDKVPACICELSMDLPPVLSIKYMSRIITNILGYMNVVKINSNLRSIYIGKNPEIELDSLVDFQTFESTPRIDGFFERWDVTQMLMFQYLIKRKSDDSVVTCLRAVYKNGYWTCKFYKESTLQVITTEEFEK